MPFLNKHKYVHEAPYEAKGQKLALSELLPRLVVANARIAACRAHHAHARPLSLRTARVHRAGLRCVCAKQVPIDELCAWLRGSAKPEPRFEHELRQELEGNSHASKLTYAEYELVDTENLPKLDVTLRSTLVPVTGGVLGDFAQKLGGQAVRKTATLHVFLKCRHSSQDPKATLSFRLKRIDLEKISLEVCPAKGACRLLPRCRAYHAATAPSIAGLVDGR